MLSLLNFDLTDLFIAIGEIVLIASCLYKDMLKLRLVMNIGLAFYISAGIHAGYNAPGMKALIFFSAINFVANLYRIWQIHKERNLLLIPDDYRTLYEKNFSAMIPGEFLKLQKLAKIQTASKSSVLFEKDQHVKDLFLITKGQVKVIIQDKVKTFLGPHSFIGEMSFLSGDLTTAKVVATEDIELMVWHGSTLSQLERDDASLYIHLTKSIANNLIIKLRNERLPPLPQ